MQTFFIQYGWFVVILIAVWTLPWKIMALWRAAKRGEKLWFIILLVVNSLAIPGILYIYVFSRQKSLLSQIKEKMK